MAYPQRTKQYSYTQDSLSTDVYKMGRRFLQKSATAKAVRYVHCRVAPNLRLLKPHHFARSLRFCLCARPPSELDGLLSLLCQRRVGTLLERAADVGVGGCSRARSSRIPVHILHSPNCSHVNYACRMSASPNKTGKRSGSARTTPEKALKRAAIAPSV